MLVVVSMIPEGFLNVQAVLGERLNSTLWLASSGVGETAPSVVTIVSDSSSLRVLGIATPSVMVWSGASECSMVGSSSILMARLVYPRGGLRECVFWL